LVFGTFTDGSAVIYRKHNLNLEKGLIFGDGRTAFFNPLHFGDFHCGLAGIDTGNSFGYLNRKGEFRIKPKFTTGEDFVEDRAFVTGENGTYLMNTDGKIIRKFPPGLVTNPFNDGYALISKISDDGESRSDAFIDRDGNIAMNFSEERQILYPGEFSNPHDFYSEGLIRLMRNDKYGFKNLNGEIVIDPVYDLVLLFNDGYSMAEKNGRSGFINRNGHAVIPFEYDSAGVFSEGLAAVMQDEKWGCIDKDAGIVIPFEFDGLGEFYNGEIQFLREGKWGLMNKDMQVIVEAKYDYISHFNDGILEFVFNNKKGVLDRSGNELISDLIIGCEYHWFN
jgi:hypothetical protein